LKQIYLKNWNKKLNSKDDGEKFIMLTDEDMKSVPKIKDIIENIGTVE